MFIRKGFDVSYYQEQINFDKMKAYGAEFVIPRCGYGAWQDPRVAEYMTQNVLPTATDHYYVTWESPKTQADFVVKILEPYKNKIRRVWLDMEFSILGEYAATKNWLTYRDIIKAAGYKVGWYTRKTWWDDKVGTLAAEFAEDPVWVAQYNNALTLIPKGWTKAMIWQKGTPSIGLEAGVESLEIDLDLWNDEFDFETEWGTAPTTGETTMDTYGRVKTVTNIREGAGVSWDVKGQMQAGDLVTASEIRPVGSYFWWKIIAWTRNGVAMTLPLSATGEHWAYGTNIEKLPAPPVTSASSLELVLPSGTLITLKDENNNVLWSGKA